MCLDIYTPHPRQRQLKKDKIVYKVIVKKNGKIETPYRGMEIVFNELYSLKKPLKINQYVSNYSAVNEGFHSIKKMKDAKSLREEMLWDFMSDYDTEDVKVVRCLIPKGSFVIKGTFGVSEAYVSNNIKYLEIIN